MHIDDQIGQWLKPRPGVVRQCFTAFFFEQLINPGCWIHKIGMSEADFIGRHGHLFLAVQGMSHAHEYIPDFQTYDSITQAELSVMWLYNEYAYPQIVQMILTIAKDIHSGKLCYRSPEKGTVQAKDFQPFKALAQEFGPSRFKDLVIET